VNEREVKDGAREIVSVQKERREVIVTPALNRRLEKSFVFDGVFGAESTQSEVFKEVRRRAVEFQKKAFSNGYFLVFPFAVRWWRPSSTRS
jgi:hypothetical protein